MYHPKTLNTFSLLHKKQKNKNLSKSEHNNRKRQVKEDIFMLSNTIFLKLY